MSGVEYVLTKHPDVGEDRYSINPMLASNRGAHYRSHEPNENDIDRMIYLQQLERTKMCMARARAEKKGLDASMFPARRGK